MLDRAGAGESDEIGALCFEPCDAAGGIVCLWDRLVGEGLVDDGTFLVQALAENLARLFWPDPEVGLVLYVVILGQGFEQAFGGVGLWDEIGPETVLGEFFGSAWADASPPSAPCYSN